MIRVNNYLKKNVFLADNIFSSLTKSLFAYSVFL